MELYLIVSYRSTRTRCLKQLKVIKSVMEQAAVRVDNVSVVPTFMISRSVTCGVKHIRSLQDDSVQFSLPTSESIYNYFRAGELELVVVPQSTIRVFHRGELAGHLSSSVKRSFEVPICNEKIMLSNRGVVLLCGFVYLINPAEKIVSFSLVDVLHYIQKGRKLEDIGPSPPLSEHKAIDFQVVGNKNSRVVFMLTTKGLVERRGRFIRSIQLPTYPSRHFTCLLHTKDWRKKGKKLLVACVQPLVKNFDLIFTYYLLNALDMTIMSEVQLFTKDMNAVVFKIARLERDNMNLYISMRSREKFDMLFEYRNRLHLSRCNVMIASCQLSCLCVVNRKEREAWIGCEKGIFKISISNIL